MTRKVAADKLPLHGVLSTLLEWHEADPVNDCVSTSRHGRMLKITVDNEISIRFKKLDEKLRSGNIKTNQQRAMYYQLSIFEGADAITEITFGYQLDESETAIRGLFFTCPIGWDQNKWILPLDDENESSTLLTLPADPDLSDTTSTGVTVKRNRTHRKKGRKKA